MAQAQVVLGVTLTEINCGKCGGTYAINERYREDCHEHGRSWHCPYCQAGWGYASRGLLEQEQARHQATLSRLNEAQAERQRLENKLKRVQRGVCPHCNRTFQNLAAHMKCKHNK
jgi:hypothetical protein